MLVPVLLGTLALGAAGHRRARARDELAADHLAARIEAQVVLRLELLDQIANAEDRPFESPRRFEARAREVLSTLPGFQAVNYIDPDGVIRWVYPEGPNRTAKGVDLDQVEPAGPSLRKALASGEPYATPAMELLQGGLGFATYFPIGSDGGALNGVFRFGPLLETVIPEAVADQVTVSLDPPEAPPPTDALLRTIDVLDRQFTLRIAPLETRASSMTPLLLLGFGTFVALLTGALVHQLGVDRQHQMDRARLESERELLSTLVESSSELAAVLDDDGRLAYINPAGRSLLGVGARASADTLRTRLEPFAPLLAPLHGAPPWSGRVQLISATGASVPTQATSFRIPGGERPRLGLVAVDISEVVTLQNQLERATRMEAIGTLAAGVAHDFNNALSVFKTGIELLQDTADMPTEALEDLALMRNAAGSAAHVAAQLLAFSKQKPGRKEPILVDQALSSSARMLSRAVREQVELVWQLGAEDAVVLADLGALQQVLLNLVLNAQEAIEGAGRIVLHTRRPSGRNEVVLEVSDDGCGISRDAIDLVFEPFYTTRPHGNGLGLAMVRRVVENLDGRVELTSEVGVGTTVRLVLPVAATDAVHATTTLPRLPHHRRARVLVVDDEAELRSLLCRALERAGHQVREAADGIEALAAITAAPPDLVIADVGMPRMGGPELALRIRREFPGVGVILMTGHLADELPADNGRIDVVCKPVEASTLLHRIDALLAPPPSSA